MDTSIYQERVFKQRGKKIRFYLPKTASLEENSSLEDINFFFSQPDLIATASHVHYCGGRGQTMLFSLAGTLLSKIGLKETEEDIDLCLRSYLRGGLIGKVLKKGFFKGSKLAHRARDEFVMLSKMQALGLPVPEPVVARECSVKGLWIHNDIVIRQIPNTKNLAEILYERELTKDEIQSIALCLRRFFTAGVLHTDLNLRNILLDTQQRCFVIDFDKCFLKKKLTITEEKAMLQRLERSFVKEEKKANNSFFYTSHNMQDLLFYMSSSS